MQIYANDLISHALFVEPTEQDMRNFFYRQSPRTLIEFSNSAMLKRSTGLARPGAVASLVSDIGMLTSFAEIETQEGDRAL